MELDDLIRPADLQPLEGPEPLGPATVLEFWRWALGDLRMNNARLPGGVPRGSGVGDVSQVRVEWGPYDVRAADGTLVEVKAAGRLQSWAAKRPSRPSWSFKSVRATTVWSDELGEWVDVEPETRVHVWVFALQTTVDPADNPLDVAQWEFRVVPHRQLLASGAVSASLSFFDRRDIAAVPFSELPHAVAVARRRNDDLGASGA